jgi:hypothetical protein
MKGAFEITVGENGYGSEVKVNGKRLPDCKRCQLTLDGNALPALNLECYALSPFEVNGEGEIQVRSIIVDQEVAKEVYESLKEIFEGEE